MGVTYIYDNSSTSKGLKNRSQYHNLDDLKTEIQKISSSLRTQLYQQAAAADAEAILELLHELCPKHTDLVNNYNFDQIMEITQ